MRRLFAGTGLQPWRLRGSLLCGGVACVGFVAAGPAVVGGEPGLAAALAGENPAALAEAVGHAGDPARGAVIFHDRALACTQCHVGGEGRPALGPDLAAMPAGISHDNLGAYLVRAVLDPSADVQPAYRGTTISTVEGQTLSGLVARETPEELVLLDATAGGRELVVPVAEIEERTPLAASFMPAGLANLLADRQQFLDLIAYLAAIAEGGPARAAALAPSALAVAAPSAANEADIDHAGLIGEWSDPKKAKAAMQRGGRLYGRVCANCHGTLDEPGSLPTAPRFATGVFKAGSDPHALYKTLTHGSGMMVAQPWMVPSQKYDVIHYIRETFQG